MRGVVRYAAIMGTLVTLAACTSSAHSASLSPLLPRDCKGAVEHEYLFGGFNSGQPSIAQAIERQTVLACKSRAEWLAAAASAMRAALTTNGATTPSFVTFIGTTVPSHGATLQNTAPENLLASLCKKYGPAPACG